MSNMEDKAIELMDKLEQLATSFTPEVIDSALAAVRISGFQELVWGVLLIGFGVLCGVAGYKGWKYCKVKEGETTGYSDWEQVMWASGVIGGIFVLSLSIPGICMLVSVWNWIAVINPKLALAHQILGF